MEPTEKERAEAKERLEKQMESNRIKFDKEGKEGCLGCFILLIILVGIITFLFHSCGSSKTTVVPLEQQQIAFNGWYSDLEQKIKFYDGVWNGYRKVMNDLSTGEVDRYTAYSKLKHINDLLNKSQQDFWHMQAPEQLSEKHRNLLNDTTSKLSTAANTRKDAVKAAMEFLDNPKPSKSQEALDNIKMSDSFTLDAAANIAKVREELEIPAPEKK